MATARQLMIADPSEEAPGAPLATVPSPAEGPAPPPCRACQRRPSYGDGFCPVCWRKMRMADQRALRGTLYDVRVEMRRGPW